MTTLLRDKIYESIKNEITYGKLSPGERLIELKLSKKFRASRSPIREALCQLESEGLIKIDKDAGITVSKLSIEEIEELYNIRLLLESYAARLSAERLQRNDVVYLSGLHRKMKAAAKAYDLANWLENNTLFHNFLIQHSGNRNLDQILDILKRRIYRYKYLTVSIPGHFDEYIQQHDGILRGVKSNDGGMAENYMKLHIKTIKQLLIDYLRKFPGVY